MTSKFEERIKGAQKSPLLARYFSGPDFPDEMPPSKVMSFQQEALKEVVARAYNNSPFYGKKMADAGVNPQDINSISDLAKMPFTAKDELRGNPWILLACDKKDISIIHMSTGTTGGEEIYIMQTWNDYYLNELTPGYPHLFNIEADDIAFNALPYEMSSAGLAFHKVFMEGCHATTIPAGKGGAYSSPEKSVKILRDIQPTIVMTTPSNAIRLAEAAREASFDLTTLPLRKMWLTGEGCSPAFRKRIEKIWGTKANFYYGSLEAGGIGAECDAHNGYHIVQGHVITEIVDPDTGKVLEPGEIGEIVVTCLLRFDTPLIRYRTQDLGYIEPDPCQCGVTFPRLFLRGRVVDEIKVKGVNLSPFYLEEFLMRIPEVGNWYQFLVKRGNNDRLRVRVELAEGVEPNRDLVDKLASKMEFAVGIPCDFEIVSKLPRPRSKTVRVVYDEE